MYKCCLDWYLWYLTWLFITLSLCSDSYIMIYWDWRRFELIYIIIVLIHYAILIWFKHPSLFHSYMFMELGPLRNTDFLKENDTLLKRLDQEMCRSGWFWDCDSIWIVNTSQVLSWKIMLVRCTRWHWDIPSISYHCIASLAFILCVC